MSCQNGQRKININIYFFLLVLSVGVAEDVGAGPVVLSDSLESYISVTYACHCLTKNA